MLKFITAIFLGLFGLMFLFTDSYGQVKLDSLKSELSENEVDSCKVRLLLEISACLMSENSSNAFNYAKEAFSLATKINYPYGVILANRQLSAISLKNQLLAEALRYHFKNLEIHKKLEDKNRLDTVNLKGLITTYQSIASINLKMQKNNIALDFYFKALDISKRMNNNKLIGNSYCEIGNYYYNDGKYDQSLEYYLKALEVFKHADDLRGEFTAYTYIGLSYDLQGNYRKALDFLLKSLVIAEQTKNSMDISFAYMNIAKIYAETHDFKKAMDYNTRSIAIYTKFSDSLSVAIITIRIAEICLEQNQYQEALNNYKKYLDYLERNNNYYWVSYAYNGIGKVYEQLENYDSASENYLMSLSFRQELGQKREIAGSYITLGTLYTKTHNYKIAENYLLKGLLIAEEIGALVLIRDAYESFSRVYSEQKKFEEAFHYYTFYKEMNDSLINEGLTKNMTQLEMEYDFQKKQELSDLERQKQQKELRSAQIFTSILLISLLLLFGATFVIYRNSNFIKRANQLLAKQKEEIQLQSESLRKKSEEFQKLSLVASHTDNAVVILNEKGDFEWVNDGFSRMYGFTLSDLEKTNSNNIQTFSKYHYIDTIIKECKEIKKTIQYEQRFLNHHGKDVFIQTTLTPILENGAIIKYISIDTDITIIKQAEEEIQKQQRELQMQADMMALINSELSAQKEAMIEKNEELQQQREELLLQADFLDKANRELQKLSLVASKTENGVAIMGADGDFEWINEGFTRLHGYTFDEFIVNKGKNIRQASSNPNISDLISNCIKEQISVTYESFSTDNERNEKWVQTTVTPIIDEGEVVKLVAIDADITKLKLAEKELRIQSEEIQIQAERLDFAYNELKLQKNEIIKQNEELQRQREALKEQAKLLEENNTELQKLSIVASKTDNSIFIANPDGRIIWVNEAFTRHSGYLFDEYIALKGNHLFDISSNPEIHAAYEECVRSKKSVVYTSKTQTKNSKDIWLQTTLTPILDNQGIIVQLIAINSDITKVKEAEYKISEQNKEINDSIQYASRIQYALSPMPIFVEAVLHDYFLLNKPKHIISGDFYMVEYKYNKAIVAVADCTGHGIPGAFMSMLGTVILKSIIARVEVLNSGEILDILRERVIKSLHQRGKEGEARDGMDISMIILDFETGLMQYSGANSPAYIVKCTDDKKFTEDLLSNGYVMAYESDEHATVIKLKPDKMPISIHDNDKIPFTTKEFYVNKNDVVYLCSDGYVDQFGGDSNSKFMSKKFRKLLLSIHKNPLAEQRILLNDTHELWKGVHEQIDDIMILGIRI